MKDWQLGYDLELLKTLKRVVAYDYKPYVFGAFGIPNERDIATALSKGQVLKTKENDTIAIYQTYNAKSSVTDFTQTDIPIQKGWVFIKHLAGSQKEKLLSFLIGNINGPLLIEIFDEDEFAKTLIKKLGFEYITTKIAASSDLKGIYCKNVRINYQLPEAEKINIKLLDGQFLSPAQMGKVRDELKQYSQWANHYSSYNKRQSWSAFALRGYDPADPDFIIKPAEMSKKYKEENPERMKAKSQWTEIAKMFPETLAIINSRFFGAIPDRVRFMRLTKGNGELARHADITDREAGVLPNKVVRLHIPIYTNNGVIFQSWSHEGKKSIINMQEGSLWYIDVRKPHTAVNNGDQDRVHLVMDFYSNEQLTEFICNGFRQIH